MSVPRPRGDEPASSRTRVFERRLSPTTRQSHSAGDKAFVDFSGKTLAIVDRRTGPVREAQIFVAVLGASSFT